MDRGDHWLRLLTGRSALAGVCTNEFQTLRRSTGGERERETRRTAFRTPPRCRPRHRVEAWVAPPRARSPLRPWGRDAAQACSSGVAPALPLRALGVCGLWVRPALAGP